MRLDSPSQCPTQSCLCERCQRCLMEFCQPYLTLMKPEALQRHYSNLSITNHTIAVKPSIYYSIYFILLIAGLGIGISIYSQTPAFEKNNSTTLKSPLNTKPVPINPMDMKQPDKTVRLEDFKIWTEEKKAAVDFLNPPEIFNDKEFFVLNPVYRYKGKTVTEIVENGYWYQNALKGARGALLIGRGNGRPPWSYKIAELYVEQDELKIETRLSFGGGQGTEVRMLLDLNETETLSKIGIAFGSLFVSPVSSRKFGYPGIYIDGTVIDGKEIESLPFVPLKDNWIVINHNLTPTSFSAPTARVIWFQFLANGESRRINN